MKHTFALIVAIAQSSAAIGAAPEKDFDAKVGRANSHVRFLAEKGKTIIDVTSDTGIDKAVIKRRGATWPMSMVVRLHLKGLESFRAANDKVDVEWSVSSTGGNATRVSLRQGHKETPLLNKSPYWTDVRIVGGNGKIPLKGGYFEVPIPTQLLKGNPPQFTIRWIDFYRN